MRQAESLLQISVVPNTVGLCWLSPVPAGRRPFPALSPQSLYGCRDPYPAAPLRCTYLLLPEGHRPHLSWQKFGTPNILAMQLLYEGAITGLQSFRYVPAPILARPPGCTYRCGYIHKGSQALYTTHRTCGYPT